MEPCLPILKARVFRKIVGAGEDILPAALSPIIDSSTFRVTAALRETARLLVTYSDGVGIIEHVYFNTGQLLVSRGLYAFDIPVSKSDIINFRTDDTTLVILLEVVERGN